MKTIVRIILAGMVLQTMTVLRADARGEVPPYPPHPGGNAGDWLGSGPVFGFEVPSLANPWKGGGPGPGGGMSDPRGGGPKGGGNGGWGGSWWELDGPLGGGAWGGWGGWGSGLGAGSGGYLIDTDTSKKGYLWPDEMAGYATCMVDTWVGPQAWGCGCSAQWLRGTASGTKVWGRCVISPTGGQDENHQCPFIDFKCWGYVP